MSPRSPTTTRKRSTSRGSTPRGRRTGARTGRSATRSTRSTRSRTTTRSYIYGATGGTRSRGARGQKGSQAGQAWDRYQGFTGPVTQEMVDELLLQALETEIGGIQVYETAIRCAQDEELKEEWTRYLEQTRNHERILNNVFSQRGLDTGRESAGRGVVRHLGESLVKAMEMAQQGGNVQAAELVASECVVLAETKDHANWQLIGEVAKALGDDGRELKEAFDEVEGEEDEHLYHTMGWSRELWIKSLGLPAVLPPPEEEKDVRSAIEAARAKQGRKKMLKGSGNNY